MEYLDSQEISQILKLHPQTTRRLIREGRIKATRIGRRYLTSSNELNKILEQGFPKLLTE